MKIPVFESRITTDFKKTQISSNCYIETLLKFRPGVPSEIRTRVAAVKGRCPRPLDDGDLAIFYIYTEKKSTWKIRINAFFRDFYSNS